MEDYLRIEELKLKYQDEDDDEEVFCEAFEEFPFNDCSEDSDVEISSSSIITLDSEFKPEESSSGNLRRWRCTSSDDETYFTKVSSLISFEENYVVYEGEKFEFFPGMKVSQQGSDNIEPNLSSQRAKEIENEEKKVNSVITGANSARVLDFLVDDVWNVRETREANSSFLTVLAGLVIKAIGYQFDMWVSFLRFPIWLSSVSFMFVMDPFSVMKQAREYLIDNAVRIWCSMFENLSIYEWLREPRVMVELVLKLMWGLLWSVYVGVVLTAMLVSAFVMSGILMRIILEEPIRMKETLDFDYTGKSPVDFVPIIACPEACYRTDCSQKLEVAKLGGVRVIPPKHKLQVTVSLTLPESDHNRNLGIFQVHDQLIRS